MPWQPTGVSADASATAAAHPVAVDGRRLLLVPWGGGWYAIEDRCSHAGCAFSDDGEIDGYHVICDCHGSEFDVRTGAVVRPPAVEPVAPVFIDGQLDRTLRGDGLVAEFIDILEDYVARRYPTPEPASA